MVGFILRHMKKLISFLLLAPSFAIQAYPINFECSVEEFVTIGQDADEVLINRNLKKRFLINVDWTKIMVTPISSIVKSRVEEYNNLSRDSVFETVRAVHDTGFGSPRVITLNENSGNTTISWQSPTIFGGLSLDCEKQ